MTTFSKLILFTIPLVALYGCQTDKNLHTANIQKSEVSQGAEIKNIAASKIQVAKNMNITNQKGTIKFMEFEGGFFGIITDNAEHYLPLGLDKQFHQDGAIIEFSAEIKHDIVTMHQWGKAIKINKIKLIKAGNSKNLSNIY